MRWGWDSYAPAPSPGPSRALDTRTEMKKRLVTTDSAFNFRIWQSNSFKIFPADIESSRSEVFPLSHLLHLQAERNDGKFTSVNVSAVWGQTKSIPYKPV
ncbi:hypothetical protein EYZ11_010594 [Aspergillus tanneri]|uniref:Uncharacterized protein n=1 Tax=Aspergillus tanneri TaxID=1220188 RepID=A0A4S3J749_9EURO|nr:hypothetical protein EYZ11_010594 [Aspergillus tanneri]